MEFLKTLLVYLRYNVQICILQGNCDFIILLKKIQFVNTFSLKPYLEFCESLILFRSQCFNMILIQGNSDSMICLGISNFFNFVVVNDKTMIIINLGIFYLRIFCKLCPSSNYFVHLMYNLPFILCNIVKLWGNMWNVSFLTFSSINYASSLI